MSKNLSGKIVEIELDCAVEKNGGGTYPGWKIVYKDASGEYRTFAKHANSLKYNAALSNGLKELAVGDEFTLEVVKEGDFLNPKNIYKGIVEVESAVSYNHASKTPSKAGNASATNSGGNTFEVNNQLKEKQQKLDEIRQPLIVRQTCLTAATNLATVFKLKTEADVLAQAKRFIAFIDTGNTGSIEDMTNDDIGVD